jgi:hypothetical protein
MTLHLKSDIATGLTTLAAAHGLSVEEYLRQLVERELPAVSSADAPSSEGSGMVWEDGLLIYGAGTALPDHVIDDAVRRSREERSQHILGHRS